MKQWTKKQVFPYIGLLVFIVLLWCLKRGDVSEEELLLRGLLLAFGYVAALGDLREKRVPNRLVAVMLGTWVMVIIPYIFLQTEQTLSLLFSGLVGFALVGALFLTVYLVSRKGLGGGDVKFMAVSGLYLGFQDVLPVMFYGSVLAFLVALTLIATKKLQKKDTIPLIPFLYIGMLLTILSR